MEKTLYMCTFETKKAVDRAPRKVIEWSPKIMWRVVMDLYEGGKTGVRVGSGLSKEFPVKVIVHQESMLSSSSSSSFNIPSFPLLRLDVI